MRLSFCSVARSRLSLAVMVNEAEEVGQRSAGGTTLARLQPRLYSLRAVLDLLVCLGNRQQYTGAI